MRLEIGDWKGGCPLTVSLMPVVSCAADIGIPR